MALRLKEILERCKKGPYLQQTMKLEVEQWNLESWDVWIVTTTDGAEYVKYRAEPTYLKRSLTFWSKEWKWILGIIIGYMLKG